MLVLPKPPANNINRIIGMPSGKYWFAGAGEPDASTTVVTANKLRAHIINLTVGATFDRILCEVTTGAVGNVRLGIYNNDPLLGYPTSLILDAGTATTDAAAVKEITISQALAAGSYWLASVFDAAPTVRRERHSNVNVIAFAIGGSTLFENDIDAWGNVSVAFTYATLPASFPAGAALGTSEGPCPGLRVA